MINKKKIKLNPSQAAFYNADEYAERSFWGGWGSGKSFVGLLTMLKYCYKYPNSSWWACRKTIPEIKETIWKDFVDDICPSDWIVRKNENDRIIVIRSCECRHGNDTTCPKCSTIRFKPLDDLGKIESANLSGIFIDQAEETEIEMLTKLKGRLRRMNAPMQYFLIIGNPHPGWPKQRYFDGSVNHTKITEYSESWIKILPAKNKEDKDTKIFVVNAQSYENNNHLPKHYIQNRLNDTTDEFAERFIKASWQHFSGAALKSLEPSKHFIDSFDTKGMEKWMAYDYGVANPYACLVFAKDRDTGKIYIIDEVFEKGKYLVDQAKGLKKLYTEHFGSNDVDLFFDHSMKGVQGSGRSNFEILQDELYKLGVYENFNMICGKKKDEQAGLQLINMLLKNEKLYVFRDKCPNVVREWPNIKYKTRSMSKYGSSNKSEELVDKDNHTFDCGKYGLNNYHVEDANAEEEFDDIEEKFRRGELGWDDPRYEEIEDKLAIEEVKTQWEDI